MSSLEGSPEDIKCVGMRLCVCGGDLCFVVAVVRPHPVSSCWQRSWTALRSTLTSLWLTTCSTGQKENSTDSWALSIQSSPRRLRQFLISSSSSSNSQVGQTRAQQTHKIHMAAYPHRCMGPFTSSDSLSSCLSCCWLLRPLPITSRSYTLTSKTS